MLEYLRELAIRLGLLPAPVRRPVPVRVEAKRRDPW
jgi:hypothetical protein